jgi:hypothetical protein
LTPNTTTSIYTLRKHETEEKTDMDDDDGDDMGGDEDREAKEKKNASQPNHGVSLAPF